MSQDVSKLQAYREVGRCGCVTYVNIQLNVNKISTPFA